MKATDNGCGIPEDKMKPEAAGFGLQIIHTLTGQLDGRIDIINKNGTAITINFN
jgi:two-component sensor histidine kinase